MKTLLAFLTKLMPFVVCQICEIESFDVVTDITQSQRYRLYSATGPTPYETGELWLPFTFDYSPKDGGCAGTSMSYAARVDGNSEGWVTINPTYYNGSTTPGIRIYTSDSSLAMTTKTLVITASVDTVPMTSCETEISFDMLFDTNYCVLVALSDPGTPVDMVFKIRWDEPDTV